MRLLIAEAIRRVSALTGAIEGYEHPDLVEEIFRKTLAFEPTEPWPEMAQVSSVLDFGGACGQHYKQARISSPNIRWAVIETDAMVAKASELSTDKLRFFTSIDEAANWLGTIELIYSSGALQYTRDPENKVAELCGVGAPKMFWERLALTDDRERTDSQFSLLGENGPGLMRHFRGRAVKFDRTIISRESFLRTHAGYRLETSGSDWFKFVKEPA